MMGTTASTTRKISIENEDEDTEIKTTESRTIEIKNIKNESEKVPAEKINNLPCPERPKTESPKDDDPEKSIEEDLDRKRELSEKELNLQYVESLKTNKENWDNKIQELKEKHEKIYSNYIEEYQKAVEFYKEHSPKERNKNAVVPCKDFKEKVLKCYNDNKTQSLVCSGVVQEFMKCLDEARCDVLEKK